MTSRMNADAILDAIDGCAYLVDRAGLILRVSRAWDDFAARNAKSSAAMPAAREVVDRDLFAMIAGGPVQQAYRDMHAAVLSGRRPAVSFTFRCDSPNTRRLMRMSISPVRARGEVTALLYQSQVLSELQRPPLRLFAAPHLWHDGIGEPETPDERPLVSICSFCHQVGWRGAEATEWIEPETYYARGGDSDVLLSHTVCPGCYAVLRRH